MMHKEETTAVVKWCWYSRRFKGDADNRQSVLLLCSVVPVGKQYDRWIWSKSENGKQICNGLAHYYLVYCVLGHSDTCRLKAPV